MGNCFHGFNAESDVLLEIQTEIVDSCDNGVAVSGLRNQIAQAN